MTKKMRLSDYLSGMQAAQTAQELEAAIQAPYKHAFSGPTWTRISKVRVERGLAICADHPLGHLVPKMVGRVLMVGDKAHMVGRGQNSTGVRWAWTSAMEFAVAHMRADGVTQRAAHLVWDAWASQYPHRCLAVLQTWAGGGLQDPVMNTLIPAGDGGGPIAYTVEQNDADEFDKRATMACACGGTLFDWGAGFSLGFTFISWHCNGCPKKFTEYVTRERMSEIRKPRVFVTQKQAEAATQ